MPIITEFRDIPEDEAFNAHNDQDIARECTRMGFPVAGFLHEIYEDAVIIIPGTFMFDWKKKKPHLGRVLSVKKKTTHHYDYDEDESFSNGLVEFVLLTAEGLQVSLSWGEGHTVYFALPEDSETAIRF